MDLKVGILAPRSFTVPLFTQQIVRGIKIGFEVAGLTPQFFIEDIGKAVDPDLVMAKANNLLMNEADLIFAVVGTKVDAQLIDLCTSVKKPLILIEAGASITRNNEIPDSPYVFTNSYNLWHNCVLLGEFAAKNIGKKALVSSAYFECGYSFFPAFEVGFKKFGGQVTGVHLCMDFKPEDFTDKLAGMIETSAPDSLVAFYNGKDANDFFEMAVKTGVTKGLPIITTSLATEPFKDSTYPVACNVVWDVNSAKEGNKRFVNSYISKHKSPPDEYAAIAYETSLAVATAVAELEGDWLIADEFCKVLTSVAVDGPRGAFGFNAETRRNNPFSTLLRGNDVVTEASLSEAEINEITDDFNTRPHSGWFNPFPCA